MSIFEQRLSSIADTKAILNARMRELKWLRDLVRQAELSARRPLSREHFRPGLSELHIGAALVHL